MSEYINVVLDHKHNLYEMVFKLELTSDGKTLVYETWQCNLEDCDYHEYRFLETKEK